MQAHHFLKSMHVDPRHEDLPSTSHLDVARRNLAGLPELRWRSGNQSRSRDHFCRTRRDHLCRTSSDHLGRTSRDHLARSVTVPRTATPSVPRLRRRLRSRPPPARFSPSYTRSSTPYRPTRRSFWPLTHPRRTMMPNVPRPWPLGSLLHDPPKPRRLDTLPLCMSSAPLSPTGPLIERT